MMMFICLILLQRVIAQTLEEKEGIRLIRPFAQTINSRQTEVHSHGSSLEERDERALGMRIWLRQWQPHGEANRGILGNAQGARNTGDKQTENSNPVRNIGSGRAVDLGSVGSYTGVQRVHNDFARQGSFQQGQSIQETLLPRDFGSRFGQGSSESQFPGQTIWPGRSEFPEQAIAYGHRESGTGFAQRNFDPRLSGQIFRQQLPEFRQETFGPGAFGQTNLGGFAHGTLEQPFPGQNVRPNWPVPGSFGQGTFNQAGFPQGDFRPGSVAQGEFEQGSYSQSRLGFPVLNQPSPWQSIYGHERIRYGPESNTYVPRTFRQDAYNTIGQGAFGETGQFQGFLRQGALAGGGTQQVASAAGRFVSGRGEPGAFGHGEQLQGRVGSENVALGRPEQSLAGSSAAQRSILGQGGTSVQLPSGQIRTPDVRIPDVLIRDVRIPEVRLPVTTGNQVPSFSNSNEQPTWLQQNLREVLLQTGHIDFLQYAQRAGLISVFNFAGVTAFIPHPLVLGNVSEALQIYFQGITALQSFVGYHLYQGYHDSSRIEDGQIVKTFDGRFSFVNKVYSHEKKEMRLWIQGIQVVTKDSYAKNGVMHVLNNVLVAPTFSIQNLLLQSSDHTVFAKLLQKHALYFQFPQGTTFFVPLDSAFKSVPQKFAQEVLNDDTKARILIRNHIIHKPMCRARLFHQSGWWQIRNSLGHSVHLYQDVFEKDTSYVNNAAVLTEQTATDGFLFGISQLLLPNVDANILEVVRQQGCTEFWQLLHYAGYTVSLSNLLQTHTVFSPSNAAIGNLPAAVKHRLQTDREFAGQVAAYHQVEGRQFSDSFAGLQQIKTRLLYRGRKKVEEASIMHLQGKLSFQGAQVLRENILGINGILHVIDKLTLPPNQTLHDIIQTLPLISDFSKIITGSRLNPLLQGEQHHTLFAPTNEAMADFASLNGNWILEEESKARALVKRHMLLNSFYKSGMRLHTVYEMQLLEGGENGQTNIRLESRGSDESQLYLEDYKARAVRSDISATNGVLFVVNKVLHKRDK